MSSPMMNRMLGFCVVAACACAGILPLARKLETATAPNASFRKLAPRSMSYSFQVILVGLPGEGCGESCDDHNDQPTNDFALKFISFDFSIVGHFSSSTFSACQYRGFVPCCLLSVFTGGHTFVVGDSAVEGEGFLPISRHRGDEDAPLERLANC